MTLALGTRLASSGSGGNVTPADLPILRRALVTDQLSEPLVLEFDTIALDFLVASDGTYDVISLEGGILPINVLTEASDKFILTVN